MEGSGGGGHAAVAEPAASAGAAEQALLQFAFGAGFAVLEPVVDVGVGDGAILAEVQGDVFDALLVGRAAVALLEHPLQVLQLVLVCVPSGALRPGGVGARRPFFT